MEITKKVWFKPVAIIVGILILILGIRACNSMNKSNESAKVDTEETTTSSSTEELSDYEMEQLRLIKRFGDAGKGYRWSDDGTRLALGDPNLTETEVAYTFLRSVSTLDFATAQKYAYNSKVLNTVNTYFSKDSDFTYDESFKKSMYQEVLLSLEPISVINSATFADNKANIAMKVKVLDLSNKDFWLSDTDEIYSALTSYGKTEQDSVKARNYLYDYVLNYWRSEQAVKKEVQINLVLTQTKEGGWLVNIDTDLDNYAKYVEGETVVNNILKSYQEYMDGIE